MSEAVREISTGTVPPYEETPAESHACPFLGLISHGNGFKFSPKSLRCGLNSAPAPCWMKEYRGIEPDWAGCPHNVPANEEERLGLLDLRVTTEDGKLDETVSERMRRFGEG